MERPGIPEKKWRDFPEMEGTLWPLQISLNPRTPCPGSFPSEAPPLSQDYPADTSWELQPTWNARLGFRTTAFTSQISLLSCAKEKLGLGWLWGLTYSSLRVERACLFTHSFTYQLSFISDSHPHYQTQWVAPWQGSAVLEISRFEQVSCSGGEGGGQLSTEMYSHQNSTVVSHQNKCQEDHDSDVTAKWGGIKKNILKFIFSLKEL